MRGLPAAKLYRPGRDNRAPWLQIGRAPVLVRAKRGLPINTPTARHCPWALAGNAARYQSFVFNFAGTWESIYLNLNLDLDLDLDGPPRRRPHCRIFAGSGPFQKPRRAAMPCATGGRDHYCVLTYLKASRVLSPDSRNTTAL